MITWGDPPVGEHVRDIGNITTRTKFMMTEQDETLLGERADALTGRALPIESVLREARHMKRREAMPWKARVNGKGTLRVGAEGWSYEE